MKGAVCPIGAKVTYVKGLRRQPMRGRVVSRPYRLSRRRQVFAGRQVVDVQPTHYRDYGPNGWIWRRTWRGAAADHVLTADFRRGGWAKCHARGTR